MVAAISRLSSIQPSASASRLDAAKCPPPSQKTADRKYRPPGFSVLSALSRGSHIGNLGDGSSELGPRNLLLAIVLWVVTSDSLKYIASLWRSIYWKLTEPPLC